MEAESLSLEERVALVQKRVEDACGRSGRAVDEVVVLPVTKKHPPESIDALQRLGFQAFGESRVQEAGAKIAECSGGIEWHMIGHLQSNKARHAVEMFTVIHSVDSFKLLAELDRQASVHGASPRIFIQVNVSGEASKSGVEPAALIPLLDQANNLNAIQPSGLMTIPPATAEPEQSRIHFAALRTLRDEASAASGFTLDDLSMGMSNDFDIAIEEGATVVRLGTILTGKRPA